MAKFNEGDKVLVNGSMVATVALYDEQSGQLRLVQDINGGTNTIYGPIQSYRLEHLVQEAVTEAPTEDDEPAVAEGDEGPKDQFTTAGDL